MTTYISLNTALYAFENAYLVSTVLLLAFSYLGLVAIATIEKTDKNSSLSKWFM